MTSAVEDGVAIRDTGKYGLGAYAARSIQEGAIPCDYEGEILEPRDVSARYNQVATKTFGDYAWLFKRKANNVGVTGDYLFAISDALDAEPGIFVDAEDPWRSNWARFINHCPETDRECNLRCRSLASDMNGKPRVWFVATRDIEVGEELLYDYGDDYWGELYKD